MNTATKTIRISTLVSATLLSAIANVTPFGVLGLGDSMQDYILRGNEKAKTFEQDTLLLDASDFDGYDDTPYYAIEQAQEELGGKLVIADLYDDQDDYGANMPSNVLLMQDKEQMARFKQNMKDTLSTLMNINSADDAKRLANKINQTNFNTGYGNTEIEIRLGDFDLRNEDEDGKEVEVVEYRWNSQVILQLPMIVNYQDKDQDKMQVYLKYALDARDFNGKAYVEMPVDFVDLLTAIYS